jgi:hypothetical protein
MAQQTLFRIAFSICTMVIASCARPSSSQSKREPYCFAPPAEARMMWSLKDDYTLPSAKEDAATATHRLVGRWEVLTVQTMGADSVIKQHVQWRFVAPDSVHRLVQCAEGPCGHRDPMIVAIGVQVSGNESVDSAALVSGVARPDRAEVTYDTLNRTFGLHFGPIIPDGPGPMYSISTLADSSIKGRWVDGGLRGNMVRRGGVDFFELPEGYFCARRIGITHRTS